MTRWLVATWLAVLVPFGLAAATGGPEGPFGHIGFHLAYVTFAVAAIVFVLLLRRTSRSRATRIAALVVAGAQTLFIVGQAAELVVVFGEPGPDIGEQALHDPAHDLASVTLTAPGLLLTAAALIALTVIFSRTSKRSTAVDARVGLSGKR
ncbi:hypothetical protein [Leifsonia sp. TF02-11]|uniref:hypothetical protein n=1 Tax=Leifsonia sp. TF02-11 TaxID=2815212 RepID=UPI001AA12E23|nr:hypothetical protein [Leifsonia sp. TF02-11]MBO1738905.1 hypothetical protein [Leifsonia sp. TF02-11]